MMQKKKLFYLVAKDNSFAIVGSINPEERVYVAGTSMEFNKQNLIRVYYALLSLSRIHLGKNEDPKALLNQIIEFFENNWEKYRNRFEFQERVEKLKDDTLKRRLKNVYNALKNWFIMEPADKDIDKIIAELNLFYLNGYASELIRNYIYRNLDLSIYNDSPHYDASILSISPFPHQKRAIMRWHNQIQKGLGKNYALFLEPRLGKTLIALYGLFYELKNTQDGVYKSAIIIAPIRTIRHVWVRQIESFINPELLDDVEIIVLDDLSVKERATIILNAKRIAEGLKKHIIIITNYETFSRLNTEYVKQISSDGLFDFVILDEAHKIKDPSTKQTKNIMKLFEKTPIKFILTGTPYGNNYCDVYNIMKFIHDAPFGCPTLNTFIWMFGYRDRYGKFHLTDSQKFFEWLTKTSEIVRQQDVDFVIPEITREMLIMHPEHAELYQRVVKEEAIRFEQGKIEINMANVLVLINKLRQVSSGFVYYLPDANDQNSRSSFRFLEGEKISKMEYALELIEENASVSPIIVACVFEEEYRIFAERLRKELPDVKFDFLVGGMSIEKQNEILEKFDNGDIDVLIVNPKSASLGIDLSRADLIIYLSYSWSLIEERQMRDRCSNPNKRKKTKVIYLGHLGTIDKRVLDQLEGKREDLDQIMKLGGSKIVEYLSGLEKQQDKNNKK
jgi:SNF2 family DNA or RNA helicase